MLVMQLICFLLRLPGVQHKVFCPIYLREHMAVKWTVVEVCNSMIFCVVNDLFIAVEKISSNGYLIPWKRVEFTKYLTDEISLFIMAIELPDLPTGL